MDARDAIAMPATIAFVALGVHAMTRNIRARPRRERERSGEGGPSRWQLMSRRERLVRRTLGIGLGIGVAVALQLVAQGVIRAVSR